MLDFRIDWCRGVLIIEEDSCCSLLSDSHLNAILYSGGFGKACNMPSLLIHLDLLNNIDTKVFTLIGVV